jgi:hypothetical protein
VSTATDLDELVFEIVADVNHRLVEGDPHTKCQAGQRVALVFCESGGRLDASQCGHSLLASLLDRVEEGHRVVVVQGIGEEELDQPDVAQLERQEARDLPAIVNAFAPDAEFRSPITERLTFKGHDEIGAIAGVILDGFDDLHYTDELSGEGIGFLVSSAPVDRLDIEIVDHLLYNPDGKIEELTVFFRPLPAAAVALRLIGAGLGRRKSPTRAVLIGVCAVRGSKADGERLTHPYARGSHSIALGLAPFEGRSWGFDTDALPVALPHPPTSPELPRQG